MLVFLPAIIFATWIRLELLPEFSADWAQKAQSLCLQIAPDQSPHSALYQSIVCGKNLPANEAYSHLRNAGLLHLLVVSGGHLYFLISFLDRLRLGSDLIKAPALLGFSILTGFQAPVVRALFQMGTGMVTSRAQLFLCAPQRVLLAGLTTLVFFPSWISSLSFQLSWACSLALALLPSSAGIWLRSTVVYAFLFPFLLGLGNPTIFSILGNVLFGGFIGSLLFPLSALTYLVPFITPGVDLIWNLFLWALEQFPAAGSPQAPLSSAKTWGLLLLAHLLVEWKARPQ